MNEPLADEDTRPSLLQSASAGDERALETIVRVYSPTIFAWCKRAGLRSEDAGDVVQESWVSVAAALPRFDHARNGATFRGWLYTIARNKLRDRARRASDAAFAEGVTDARRRIEALPADEYDESRSEPETGAPAAVHRAIQEIRTEFEDRTYRMFGEDRRRRPRRQGGRRRVRRRRRGSLPGGITSPRGSPVVRKPPRPDGSRILDRAARELAEDSIERNFPGQPVLQVALLEAVGNTYRGVGELQTAAAILRRAYERRRSS